MSILFHVAYIMAALGMAIALIARMLSQSSRYSDLRAFFQKVDLYGAFVAMVGALIMLACLGLKVTW